MESLAWQVVKPYEDIIYQKLDGIAKITINRPHKRNAFRPQTVFEMYEAFWDAREDQNIGASRDRAAGGLGLSDLGDERRIHLKLAVHRETRTRCRQSSRRLPNPVDVFT